MSPLRRKAGIGLAVLMLSGLAVGQAFAKIEEVPIECQNPSGKTPGGQQPECRNDNLTQESENQNPSGKAPPGQN
jgi:hypothetical protein